MGRKLCGNASSGSVQLCVGGRWRGVLCMRCSPQGRCRGSQCPRSSTFRKLYLVSGSSDDFILFDILFELFFFLVNGFFVNNWFFVVGHCFVFFRDRTSLPYL